MSPALTILFATMTGNAEDCALRAAKKLQSLGYAPRVVNMRDASADELANAEAVLVVASTWGDGEPPDDAIPYWEKIRKLSPGALGRVRFAVLALGDRAYEQFCGFGRECDETFERLGAARFHPRLDCDMDHEDQLDGWIGNVAAALEAVSAGAPGCGAGR